MMPFVSEYGDVWYDDSFSFLHHSVLMVAILASFWFLDKFVESHLVQQLGGGGLSACEKGLVDDY